MAQPADRSNPGDEVWAWLERRYREHRSQLYRYALGVLGNREDAEDALQIALLNAHRALLRGERPLRPRAWLFAIALNVCRRLLQTRARRARAVVTQEPRSLQRGADTPTGAEISLAVASLPPGQREIFLLRELQGLSYAELSQRLGLSPAAAESLLSRARRRMREQLAGTGDVPDVGRPPRRRPLLGFPGAFATLRVARGPTALKLAGLVGATALVPVAAIGLHVRSEKAPRPVVQAASRTVIQPVTQPRLLSGAVGSRRASTRLGWTARTAAAPARRSVLVAARAPLPAGHQAAPAALEGAAAPPAQPAAAGAAEAVDNRSTSAAAEPPPAVSSPPAGSLDPAIPTPAPETRLPEVVEEAVTTVQDAVDGLVPGAPVPAVPAPPVPDPVSQVALPDPPSVTVPDLPSVTVPDPPAVTVPDLPSVTIPDPPSVTVPDPPLVP
jgi:RNA polymerase sigma-70 factor, ECF subfamily